MFPWPPIKKTVGAPGKIRAGTKTADIASRYESPFFGKCPAPSQPDDGIQPIFIGFSSTQRTAEFKLAIHIRIADAAVRLERAVAALSYVANECDEDLEKYCESIAPGEGRLMECLEKHDKDVSGRCKQAIKDVGFK